MKDNREVSLIPGRMVRSWISTACDPPAHPKLLPGMSRPEFWLQTEDVVFWFWVTCVLLAQVGFVLSEEESGIAKPDRNRQELFGKGSSERIRSFSAGGMEAALGRNLVLTPGEGQEPFDPPKADKTFPCAETLGGLGAVGFAGQQREPSTAVIPNPAAAGDGQAGLGEFAAPCLRDSRKKGADPSLSRQGESSRLEEFHNKIK